MQRTSIAAVVGLLLAAGCEFEQIAPTTVMVVSVRPAERTLRKGDTLQLSAKVFTVAGQEIEGPFVEWSTSDPAVVAVDQAGEAVAAGLGTATVTAEAGTVTGETHLTVLAEVGYAVTLLQAPTFLIEAGDSTVLEAEALNVANEVIVQPVLVWTSRDTSVVTVGRETGRLAAVRPGEAYVLVRADDARDSVRITVSSPRVPLGEMRVWTRGTVRSEFEGGAVSEIFEAVGDTVQRQARLQGTDPAGPGAVRLLQHGAFVLGEADIAVADSAVRAGDTVLAADAVGPVAVVVAPTTTAAVLLASTSGRIEVLELDSPQVVGETGSIYVRLVMRGDIYTMDPETGEALDQTTYTGRIYAELHSPLVLLENGQFALLPVAPAPGGGPPGLVR